MNVINARLRIKWRGKNTHKYTCTLIWQQIIIISSSVFLWLYYCFSDHSLACFRHGWHRIYVYTIIRITLLCIGIESIVISNVAKIHQKWKRKYIFLLSFIMILFSACPCTKHHNNILSIQRRMPERRQKKQYISIEIQANGNNHIIYLMLMMMMTIMMMTSGKIYTES